MRISKDLLTFLIIDTLVYNDESNLKLKEKLHRQIFLRNELKELPELNESTFDGVYYSLYLKYKMHYHVEQSADAVYATICSRLKLIRDAKFETIEFFKCSDCLRFFKTYNMIQPDDEFSCPFCQSKKLYFKHEVPAGLLMTEQAFNNAELFNIVENSTH